VSNTKIAFALVLSLGMIATTASAQTKKPATAKTKAAAKPAAKPAAPTRLAFIVAPEGNEARYRVREQLVGVDLPNDAIGVTKDITGRIVVLTDGSVIRDSSKIVVNLTNLKSDRDRRDGFIKRRTLETEKFPTVELVPTSLVGILGNPPASGTKTFDVVGALTIRGVARPTTWNVTAKFDQGAVTGTATTKFTFADAGMEQPRVPVVLSVADTIKLEYDFRLVPDTTKR
jgi:polyisoprenoid-binding protein YceI